MFKSVNVKYFLLSVLLFVFASFSLNAIEKQEFDADSLTKNTISYDSYKLVDDLLDEIYSVLGDKTLSPDDYNSIISGILDKNFALKYMAIWVIANYRDQMTYDLLERYYIAFKQYIILYYGALVQNYSGQLMVIKDVKQRNETTAVVTIAVDLGSSDPILIDWTIKRKRDSSSVYVVDIAVSGISLLATQRAEYETIIRQNNKDLSKFASILEQKVQDLTEKVTK